MRFWCVLLVLCLLQGNEAFSGIGKLFPGLNFRAPSKSLAERQLSTSQNLRAPLPRVNKKVLKMAIPSELVLPAMALSCLSPTLLGLWKTEYTVSYGYGLSMAFSGMVTLASLPIETVNIVAQMQALCFILYGLRLSAYLLYREINIPDIFRREAKGNPIARLPTILGCSLLYLCMAAPLRIVSLAGQYTTAAQVGAFVGLLLMYGGWALAAFGDYQKSHLKAKQGNGLVTEGIFALLRHPNYTGEQIMWSGSFLCSVAAGLFTATGLSGPALAGWLLSSAAGTAGIWFVLLQATASLEKRQATKYASGEWASKYAEWVGSSWVGFALPPKK